MHDEDCMTDHQKQQACEDDPIKAKQYLQDQLSKDRYTDRFDILKHFQNIHNKSVAFH